MQNTEPRKVLHLGAEIFSGYILLVKTPFHKSSFEGLNYSTANRNDKTDMGLAYTFNLHCSACFN